MREKEKSQEHVGHSSSHNERTLLLFLHCIFVTNVTDYKIKANNFKRKRLVLHSQDNGYSGALKEWK